MIFEIENLNLNEKRNFSHQQSLTVESVHPMHLIASGKIRCQFSNQAAMESQEELMKKFSVISVSNNFSTYDVMFLSLSK